MKSITIDNIKIIMNLLLAGDYFDDFLLDKASITTYNTFTIDGHIIKSYFTDEEYALLKNKELIDWKTVKHMAYEIIKGKKTPVKFKIVLALNPEQLDRFLQSNNLSYNISDISGLYLNINYENNALSCITATSLNTFTLDKELEHCFDDYVTKLFSSIE